MRWVIILLAFIFFSSLAYSLTRNDESVVQAVTDYYGLSLIRHYYMNETGSISTTDPMIDDSDTGLNIAYYIDGGGAITQVKDVYGNSEGAKYFYQSDNQNEAWFADSTTRADLGFASSYTYSLWFNPLTYAAEQYILQCFNGNTFIWGMRFRGDGRFDHFENDNIYLGPITHNQDDTWHLWTVVQNTTQIALYIDGIHTAAAAHGSSDLVDCKLISAQQFNGNAYYGPQGNLSDISIWDEALTTEEINCLYDGGCVSGDLTPPTYSNHNNNASNETIKSDQVEFTITLEDESGLSSYIFAYNQSGTWVNISWQNISGLSYSASEIIDVTNVNPSTICGMFWFNDTSGNIAISNYSCFNVLANPQTMKFFIARDNSTKGVRLFGGGDAIFEGTVYVDSLVEGSKGLKTPPLLAYRQLLNWDLTNEETLHETAPDECKRENYGYDPLCIVKMNAQVLKLLDKKNNDLQRIIQYLLSLGRKVEILETKQGELFEMADRAKKLLDRNPLLKETNLSFYNWSVQGPHTVFEVDIIEPDYLMTEDILGTPGVNYCQILMNHDIYDIDDHYAVHTINGNKVLSVEERLGLIEACQKQQLEEMCAVYGFSWC